MKINVSVLDFDINTDVGEYEVFFFNGYDATSKLDKSVLRVKYSTLYGVELEVFGYVLLK